MENLIQIHSVKNVLSHSGCPEDLLESYLQFLQAGGQQVQIVRGEVTMMFQKEMQYRKRRNEEMKGTVTFSNKDKHNTGNSDGVYPMLLRTWDSCTGVGCAEGTWRGCGGCCGVWEVDERTNDAACSSNIA